MAEDAWDAHMRQSRERPTRFFDVLNQSWPPQEAFAAHRHLRENQPRERWVDVDVRLVLEFYGEVYTRGQAIRWWTPGRCVFVHVEDDRVNGRIAWVSADDVRRR